MESQRIKNSLFPTARKTKLLEGKRCAREIYFRSPPNCGCANRRFYFTVQQVPKGFFIPFCDKIYVSLAWRVIGNKLMRFCTKFYPVRCEIISQSGQ